MCTQRDQLPLGAPWYPEPEWGRGRRRPVVPPEPPHRAQATNLSVRTCQQSRGSSCVSPDPFPSKHRGLPAPTTTIIAFLACLGRPLPSPPFLLSSQLGLLSIGTVHPPSGPMLPLAAGQSSARRPPPPHPPRRPPTHPLRPRQPAKHAGIGRPRQGACYIRRAVRALGTRVSNFGWCVSKNPDCDPRKATEPEKVHQAEPRSAARLRSGVAPDRGPQWAVARPGAGPPSSSSSFQSSQRSPRVVSMR